MANIYPYSKKEQRAQDFMNHSRLVPHILLNLQNHHKMYSSKCNAIQWEEICCNSLKASGFGSDWVPNLSHKIGTDQETDGGTEISNKSGRLSEDELSLIISGSRLTKHNTIQDKLDALTAHTEDYVYSLATKKSFDANNNCKYYFIVIDTEELDYGNQDWEQTGPGWACEANDYTATITRSMSDQLWTNISASIFELCEEIDI